MQWEDHQDLHGLDCPTTEPTSPGLLDTMPAHLRDDSR